MLRHTLWLNPALWQSEAQGAKYGPQLKHAAAGAGKPRSGLQGAEHSH